MIEIFEPRYHDRTVLVAKYKIVSGKDCQIKLLKGAYKGIYLAKAEVIKNSKISYMTTKAGKQLEMVAIPLDKLERIGE